MSTSPTKPLSFNSPRASPFRRPDSELGRSPSTLRASTPSSSPTKLSLSGSHAGPDKPLSPSLSPEKHNPFSRRPSQLNHGSERPTSPFARPASRLSVVESPSRTLSFSREKPESPLVRDTPSPAYPEPAAPVSPSLSFQEPAVHAPEPTPAPQSPVYDKSPAPPSPSQPTARTPTPGAPIYLDGGPSSPSYAMSPSPSRPAAHHSMPRPTAHRTVTASTNATVRPFSLHSPTLTQPTTSTPTRSSTFKPFGAASGNNYNHIPQPLLRSMRESFEVLDSANAGTIDSASLATLLDQLGMDSSPRALMEFFPPNAPASLNLARYLDMLSAPHADLSHPDELTAAFGAFDVDDSGQVDLAELRDALLHTAPEPGRADERLSERQVDAIMADFASRRAFGGKGLFGRDLGGAAGAGVAGQKGRGDVFRYRDFMAGITGGVDDSAAEQVGVA